MSPRDEGRYWIACIKSNYDTYHVDSICSLQSNTKRMNKINSLLHSSLDILYGASFEPSLSASCDDELDSFKQSAPRM